MTIDEIDFSKLKPYNKSQYQSFELLWYLICKEELKEGQFTPIDDSGGGDGVEFYLTLENGDVWGWQCKFFNRLSESGRKNQIKDSLKKACEIHGKSLKKWFLCSMSDFTPNENRWFTKELISLIPSECNELELFHHGESDLCEYLLKYPSIGNAFFGTNRLDDSWVESQYSKVMGRVEIKDKYIGELHSETEAQEEIYCYIGGPLLGRDLIKRKEDTRIINCLREFKDSVKELSDFDCDDDFRSIKDVAINLTSTASTILSNMFVLYDQIITELDSTSASSLINGYIEEMYKHVSKLQQVYEDLSSFKIGEILAPVNWNAEEKEENPQLKHRIKIAREKFLAPYFVLDNYWSPIYYVFGRFGLIKNNEVHIKGNASKGKSHLVLNLLNQYHDLKLPAIYISAKDIKSQDNVKSQILQILDLQSSLSFHDLLSNLNMLGKIHGVKTLLIIDGLNESLYWNQIWKSGISEIRSEINAESFENLILITTYRSSYEEEIFEDYFYKSGNHDLRINVFGFDYDNFQVALKKYTDYYDVSMSNDENVTSLFRGNPLALRIFCITNRGCAVSLSNITIFNVFEKYLEYCNTNIVGSLKLPKRYNKSFLIQKLSSICDYAWENNTNRVPLCHANLTMEELFAIEGEDLLIYREWGGQEDILFTYDLLAGYLIAQNLLQQYSDKESYLSAFNSTILPKLIIDSNGNQHPLFDDILSCLIILSIDKFGFIYKDYTDKVLIYHIIKAIYQSSIKTIRQNEVKIKQYLHLYLLSSKDIFSLSSSVAFSPENPLNFNFTSDLLMDMTIWERDLLWTAKIMEDLRYENLDESISDLITELSLSNSEFMVSNVAANYLMWTLTTNCHKLRFLVTKTLFFYALKQPIEFIELLRKSFSINDLYVPERMLAVAYGFVLVNHIPHPSENHKKLILDIASLVWNTFFTSNPILKTPHINIRYYSQRIIEIAKKLYPEDFKKNTDVIYAPYGITKTDIDSWEKVTGWSGPMQMDFSNYTIGSLIRDGHSYSDPELKQRVRGYIMQRITDLGWNEFRFGLIDNNINRYSDFSRHNDSDKIDRFGKKYSWIAYYEVAGILQDNGLIYDEYDKWRPAGIDIDPTFPIESAEKDAFFLDILGKDSSMDNWLNETDEFDFGPKLCVNHNSSKNTIEEFICLYGYISVEDKSIDRSRFAFIRPLIIKTEKLDIFIDCLQDEDLSRHNLLDVKDNFSCSAGEMSIFNHATYSNWGEMSFKTPNDEIYNAYIEMDAILKSYLEGNSELDPEGKLDYLIDVVNSESFDIEILVPTMNYCVSFDCSIGSCMTLSKEVIISENLYFVPRTFDLQDSNGKLAFYNVTGTLDEDKSQHYSYLRRDILDKFLKKHNLSMVWLIWGEKDHACRPLLFKRYKQLIKYTTNSQNE